MRAALFIEAGLPLVVETVPDPQPGRSEVIVKVARCGVCGTDLHATSGEGRKLPRRSQLGHEFAGEIVELGSAVTALKVGDRVAGVPVVGCGHCDYCRTGIDVLCRTMQSYGKGLAEYVRIPDRGAVLLPASVSAADGALIEPLAVARRAVRLAGPSHETRCLVIGPGPIGLGVVFWLRRAGVRNIVVLSSSQRRRGLAEAMGADHFIVENAEAAVQIEAALGGPPEFVFEAAGVPGVIVRAIELVRPQGMIVALGFCMSAEPLIPAAALMKDVTLRFSVTYSREDYAACAAALEADANRARSMVTDVVSLDGFPAAFEALRKGRSGGGKLLVDPWMMS